MSNPAHPIGKIIPEVMKRVGHPERKGKFLTVLTRDWVKIVGESQSGKTRPVGLKQNILQVAVKSSSLLYELAHFRKEQILQRLQTCYPEENIRNINFKAEG